MFLDTRWCDPWHVSLIERTRAERREPHFRDRILVQLHSCYFRCHKNWMTQTPSRRRDSQNRLTSFSRERGLVIRREWSLNRWRWIWSFPILYDRRTGRVMLWHRELTLESPLFEVEETVWVTLTLKTLRLDLFLVPFSLSLSTNFTVFENDKNGSTSTKRTYLQK